MLTLKSGGTEVTSPPMERKRKTFRLRPGDGYDDDGRGRSCQPIVSKRQPIDIIVSKTQ